MTEQKIYVQECVADCRWTRSVSLAGASEAAACAAIDGLQWEWQVHAVTQHLTLFPEALTVEGWRAWREGSTQYGRDPHGRGKPNDVNDNHIDQQGANKTMPDIPIHAGAAFRKTGECPGCGESLIVQHLSCPNHGFFAIAYAQELNSRLCDLADAASDVDDETKAKKVEFTAEALAAFVAKIQAMAVEKIMRATDLSTITDDELDELFGVMTSSPPILSETRERWARRIQDARQSRWSEN